MPETDARGTRFEHVVAVTLSTSPGTAARPF
jgi:hypothetical protein